MKSWTAAGVIVLASALNGAFAQSGAPVKLTNVGELSGAGATVGTNFKNGELGQTRIVDTAARILADTRIGQLFLGGTMEAAPAA